MIVLPSLRLGVLSVKPGRVLINYNFDVLARKYALAVAARAALILFKTDLRAARVSERK